MARNDPQVNFRIPAELKEKLEESARNNDRTITAELIKRLENSFNYEENFPATYDFVGELDERVERLEKNMSKVLGHLSLYDPEPD